MKNCLIVAALIFSAFVSASSAQDATPTPETPQSPEMQTTISTGSPMRLPVNTKPVTDLLRLSQKATHTPPDSKTRWKRYANDVVGPYALARQVAGAGIATWRNSPEEWGGQWEGFGKRLASGFGKNLIKQTTIYGLDAAFKLDSHYYKSEKRDTGSKFKNALLSTVTTRNSRGKRVVGFPRLVGTYTGAIVAAETWYPDRYDWKDGVKSGTISLGLNAAFNLLQEFVFKK